MKFVCAHLKLIKNSNGQLIPKNSKTDEGSNNSEVHISNDDKILKSHSEGISKASTYSLRKKPKVNFYIQLN